MNDDNTHPFIVALAGTWKLLAAWLASISLLQAFHTLLGICSTAAVLGYTLWKWRKEVKESRERKP